MKTFLESMKARAAQARGILETAEQLQELERVRDQAEKHFKALGTGGTVTVGSQRQQLHDEWTNANQAVGRLKQSLNDADRVLKECEPYLSAYKDLATIKSEHKAASAEKAAADEEISNLQRLVAEINSEIKELTAKVKQALDAHGQSTVAARLAGQQAQQTPKQLVALNTDLESRQATLEAAQKMLSEAEGRRDKAAATKDEKAHVWYCMRERVATIEYHDAIASITPQLTKYLAAQRAYGSYKDRVEIKPGDDAIDAAAAMLSGELDS